MAMQVRISDPALVVAEGGRDRPGGGNEMVVPAAPGPDSLPIQITQGVIDGRPVGGFQKRLPVRWGEGGQQGDRLRGGEDEVESRPAILRHTRKQRTAAR